MSISGALSLVGTPASHVFQQEIDTENYLPPTFPPCIPLTLPQWYPTWQQRYTRLTNLKRACSGKTARRGPSLIVDNIFRRYIWPQSPSGVVLSVHGALRRAHWSCSEPGSRRLRLWTCPIRILRSPWNDVTLRSCERSDRHCTPIVIAMKARTSSETRVRVTVAIASIHI